MTSQAFGYGANFVLSHDPTGFLTEGIGAVNGKINVDPYQLPKGNDLEDGRGLTNYKTVRQGEVVSEGNDLYGLPRPPDFEGTGLLGLPVFARIDFLAPAGWVRLSLLDPIVEIARHKNIVSTDIQGRNGTVKEYISDGDYAVTIKGILASDPTKGAVARRYPEQEVKALRDIIDLRESIPVTGRLFKLFGIHNLVIHDHAWPALPGFTNLQAFELRCLSDEPIELILKQDGHA
ncbi:MAG: hypothetical protein EOO63_05170 [Hymenobacter sp.]|nr:MAG: hypothetical protein EOO63_05170 [Hymenobacter sp.]